MVHRLHEEARIREEEKEAMRAKRKRRNLILLLR
jgi:hypothetical protein